MTARVSNSVKDQNGEKCALIKVVTNQKGFVWEAGMLGIQKIEKKTGEYWVYVPHGSEKITIKHDKLGVLRDYVYPEAIKKAKVYEMVLTTGNVKTVVEKKEIESQWLIFKTEPKGATVFINDELAGTTPFQRKYKKGKYIYRIEKNKYHTKAGKFTLKEEKRILDLNLKPQFGNIKVTTEPENGMKIFLNDEYTGKTTPATLNKISSGENTIQIKSKWYQPKTKKVTVQDEQTTSVAFTLQAAYANVSVTTDPSAFIIINNQRKGYGNWQGRLLEGIYEIKVRKEKYYTQTKKIEIKSGTNENYKFKLKGKTGSIDIVTEPIEGTVYLNGKEKGTTPLTIKDLLIGEYDLKIKKESFGSIIKNITIKEDKFLKIDEKLPKSKSIRVTSKPKGAKLYIDGIYKGTTPLKVNISIEEHTVKLEKYNFQPLSKEIMVEGDMDIYNFNLKPKYRRVKITSAPSNSRIYINGMFQGKTPKYIKLPIGKSDLTLKKIRYKNKNKTINIQSNQTKFHYKLRANSNYYTTKAGAILRSTILPGWGSSKILRNDNTSNYIKGLAFSCGYTSIGVFLAAKALDSPNNEYIDSDLIKPAINASLVFQGCLVIIDYLLIIFNDNEKKEQIFGLNKSGISPRIKFGNIPRVDNKTNMLISLSISLY
jgi:thiamine phosphate synthase YjbQ (UPF0047 family)